MISGWFVASVALYSQSAAYLRFAKNEAWSFFSSVPKLLVCKHSRHSKVLRPEPPLKSTSLQEMFCPLTVNVWELSSTHLLRHGEFGVTSSADAEATSTRMIDAIWSMELAISGNWWCPNLVAVWVGLCSLNIQAQKIYSSSEGCCSGRFWWRGKEPRQTAK